MNTINVINNNDDMINLNNPHFNEIYDFSVPPFHPNSFRCYVCQGQKYYTCKMCNRTLCSSHGGNLNYMCLSLACFKLPLNISNCSLYYYLLRKCSGILLNNDLNQSSCFQINQFLLWLVDYDISITIDIPLLLYSIIQMIVTFFCIPCFILYLFILYPFFRIMRCCYICEHCFNDLLNMRNN